MSRKTPKKTPKKTGKTGKEKSKPKEIMLGAANLEEAGGDSTRDDLVSSQPNVTGLPQAASTDDQASHAIDDLGRRTTKIEGTLEEMAGMLRILTADRGDREVRDGRDNFVDARGSSPGQQARSGHRERSRERSGHRVRSRDTVRGRPTSTRRRSTARRRSRSTSSRSSRSSMFSRSRSRSYSSIPRRRHRVGEYDQRNFLGRHEKIDCIEKLLLVNVRLIKQKNEEGEDIFDIIKHIEVLVEKSVTKMYTLKALSNYDNSVKQRADKKGLKAFRDVDNSDILRYLSYDGTVMAYKLSNQPKTKPQSKPKQSQNSCYAYNRPEGCRNDPCRYKHVCGVCGVSGHNSEKCQKSEPKK